MWCCAPLPGLVIALLLGSTAYFLYSPVPEDVTEPNMLRALSASFSLIRLLGSVSETLGFSSSLNFTRAALAYISNDRVTSKSDPELEVTDTTFDGVVVRIYRPKAALHPAPALVYFHGGGFVFMNIDSTDSNTAYIAKAANIVVVSVEYRLAPEHPFPIPFEDCLHATTHLLHNAAKYGVDPKRVAVGGDSAGGNLAATVALKLRDEKVVPPLASQVLIYPSLQGCDWKLPVMLEQQNIGLYGSSAKFLFIQSYVNFSDAFISVIKSGKFITRSVREKCLKFVSYKDLPASFVPEGYQPTMEVYEGEETEDLIKYNTVISDTRYSPLMATSLQGLPPTFILSVGVDRLHDENAIYATRLKRDGVKVHWHHQKEGFHGNLSLMKTCESGRSAMKILIDYLTKTLFS